MMMRVPQVPLDQPQGFDISSAIPTWN